MKRWAAFQKALQQARTNRKEEEMKGYKGFKKGLICKDKQYAENTVFEEEKMKVCEIGMHFCPNPFDVIDHYGFVDENGSMNEFAEVEALADTNTDDGKKYCTTKLKVGAKLSFAGFVKACIDFVMEKTAVEVEDNRGFHPIKAVTAAELDKMELPPVECDMICSDKKGAQIGSSGYYAKIGSSGYYAQIGSSGYYAQIGSSGYSAKIGSSGYYAQIGSSGDSAQIGSSGGSAKIGSSGGSAKIGSSGDYAQIGSSGGSAKIGSSGDYAQIGSSGYSAQIGSSGDYAQIDSTGEDSVICCAGHGSVVKARKGSWITMSEWKFSEEKGRFIPVCVKTEYVDGEHIKEDTFYRLVNGEFKEVN